MLFLIDQSVTLVLSIIVFILVRFSLNSKRLTNAIIFALSIILLAVLAIYQVNTYPASNLLVIAFSIAGGSLFGKILKDTKGVKIYICVLLVLSTLDILSFVVGGQGSKLSFQQPSQIALAYANFTVIIGPANVFKLGILDLLVLAVVQTFFLLRRARTYAVLAYSLLTLQVPYIYVYIMHQMDGVPLIPFIYACSLPLFISKIHN